jgi:NAD(P)-dependent dehydrogenase (short-subunit alcohol dehydrogenase family)
MSIKDRVAILTGAGRGVGRATALRFTREGARAVFFNHTPAPLDDVVVEIARQEYPFLLYQLKLHETENNIASYRGE